jgi:uncharacterized protein YbjT (DUF2867 family)
MRIAVVGATGGTGRKVVELALARGHEVVAVARRPDSVPPAPGLSVRRGDVLDEESLTNALRDVEAVISCIGPTRNLAPGTIMSEGVANMIAACERVGVNRFVLQSGITLSDGSELSPWNRWVIRVLRRVFAQAINDKAIAERALRQSRLEWVIVRPAGLRDAPATSNYVAGPRARIAPLLPLPFADCAGCLVRAAVAPEWVGQIVNAGRATSSGGGGN